MSEEESRGSAGTEHAADQENSDQRIYAPGTVKASGKSWPWFKLWNEKWLLMTRGLKADRRGVLADLFVLMHSDREPVVENHTWLATATGTTPGTLKKIIDELLDLRLIERKNGHLWAGYVQDQIADQRGVSEKKSLAAKKRFEKPKRNQSDDDADAYRGEKLEERGKRGGANAPPRSAATSVDVTAAGPVVESARRLPALEAQAGAFIASEPFDQALHDLLARHTDDLCRLSSEAEIRMRAIDRAAELDQAYPDHIKTIDAWLSVFLQPRYQRDDDDEIPF